MESLDNPDERTAGLLALRTVAEAYGGLGAAAAEAGISREVLYRALSPNGNPTRRTILLILKTIGMRLSVEHGPRVSSFGLLGPLAPERALAHPQQASRVGLGQPSLLPPRVALLESHLARLL